MAVTKVTMPVTDFGEDHEQRIAAVEDATGADSTGFLAIGGVPDSYVGYGGLSVVVKATEDGLEFVSLGGSGDPVSFLGLVGTPSSWGSKHQYLRVDADSTKLEWADAPPDPIRKFTQLTDTPSSLASYPLKALRVNAAGTALEFVAFPDNSVKVFSDLSDTPDELGKAGFVVTVADDGQALTFTDPALLSEGGGTAPATTFLALTDTPSAFIAGRMVRVNTAGTMLEFVAPSWPTTFKGLSDTPPSFANKVGQSLRVAVGEGSLEFYTPAAAVTSLTQLTADCPATLGTAGQLLALNAGATALEWVDPSASVVDQFTDLVDTPTDYTGASGKYVVVSGSSLVFQTLPTIPTAVLGLTDFPVSYTGQGGKYVAVNSAANGLEFVSAPTGSGSGASGIAPIQVAVTNETSVITTGAAKVTFRAPCDFTLSNVRASLTTASSSGVVGINIKKNGTTIFSTPLTIDASEKTSRTATTAMVLGVTSILDDDEITIDIDSAGTNAVGLKVTLIPA